MGTTFLDPDRIRFESENHFFYFNNFKLKDEYKDKTKALELVNDLNNFFELKVAEVLSFDQHGKPLRLYTCTDQKLLIPDKEQMLLTKFVIKTGYNSRRSRSYYYENIIGEYGFQQKEQCENNIKQATSKIEQDKIKNRLRDNIADEIKRIMNKYLINANDSDIEIVDMEFQSIMQQNKFRKKRKIGNQWSLSHQNAYGSEIERILGEELKKMNIPFIQQQEIFNKSILMTVLDFYIEEPKLAIYCDGFQYHYDKDSVIKDRAQDRVLQRLGYKVLRYTGSEIVGNVRACVNEIQEFIWDYEFSKKALNNEG